MPDPIRIAIIGTGLIVTGKHWPALHSLPRDFCVIALVNRTPAKAEALAKEIGAATRRRPAVYTDYREMLVQEKPDAVSLALPTHLNPEATEAALAAGSHVIAEKPIAANLTDAARMLPWAEQYQRTLMIAENYRYTAGFSRAAELIADGVIGAPQAGALVPLPLYDAGQPILPHRLAAAARASRWLHQRRRRAPDGGAAVAFGRSRDRCGACGCPATRPAPCGYPQCVVAVCQRCGGQLQRHLCRARPRDPAANRRHGGRVVGYA